MSNIPEDLHYTKEHEWISGIDDGLTLTVGITAYAAEALGDVVYVQVPEVGSAVTTGDAVGEVESTKSVSDIFAPVAGTIVAVNTDLADAPETLNSDPYGEGWICVIEPSDGAGSDGLLDAVAYTDLIAD